MRAFLSGVVVGALFYGAAFSLIEWWDAAAAVAFVAAACLAAAHFWTKDSA